MSRKYSREYLRVRQMSAFPLRITNVVRNKFDKLEEKTFRCSVFSSFPELAAQNEGRNGLRPMTSHDEI